MMLKQASYIFVIIRIAFGLFFVLVGASKIISPYQNFLYVIQSYEVFPSWMEYTAARVVPWVEFLFGVFLMSGLWLKTVLQAFMLLVGSFIVIIAQALIRKLPITDCGCFGKLSMPPEKTILFDCFLLFLTILMLKKFNATSQFSLDNFTKAHD